jgi:hypothetical protein
VRAVEVEEWRGAVWWSLLSGVGEKFGYNMYQGII